MQAARTPLPGDYGVGHGSGLVGELIRHATNSWAGHAFIYVGEGFLIEGQAPAARIMPVTIHPDAIWSNEQLTEDQRILITNRAHALIGTAYDYPAYIGFALEVMKLRTGGQLDPVFKSDNWRVCSALVDDCYQFAGVDLFPGEVDPNLISPADLYDRIRREQITTGPAQD